jgi:homoserine kinase
MWGRNDYQKINQKGFASKIVGADLPLETERNVAGVAGLALLDAVETDFGFDIEIYKNIKAGSGIGKCRQCSRSSLWNQCLTGNPI